MARGNVTLHAVGDVWLNRPEPESAFALVSPTLGSADLVFGNCEAVYTRRGINQFSMVENQPCDPENVRAFRSAGFNIMNVATNHIFDWGVTGVEDTINGVRGQGIAVFGAGMNIHEARKPALLERNGTRIGFLGYWCGDPKEAWASPAKPGAAYVKIITHYEPPAITGGPPPDVYTLADPVTLSEMERDIRQLRPECDVLIVSLHKGVVHRPVEIAMYERQVARAAVDAGADLILGHHAHILKGIEQYRGKIIYHGLGNFVFDWDVSSEPSFAAQQWLKKRTATYGFAPDPEWPSYPFHPDAWKTTIAKCVIEDGRITKAGYLPCWINKRGQPELLGNNERGNQVFEYIDRITREAGLNVSYAWEGDEVTVKAD